MRSDLNIVRVQPFEEPKIVWHSVHVVALLAFFICLSGTPPFLHVSSLAAPYVRPCWLLGEGSRFTGYEPNKNVTTWYKHRLDRGKLHSGFSRRLSLAGWTSSSPSRSQWIYLIFSIGGFTEWQPIYYQFGFNRWAQEFVDFKNAEWCSASESSSGNLAPRKRMLLSVFSC